jgi:hypothetical protein
VKIGLVAFRDKGDDYVTRDFPLSSDLDAAYATLSGFQAEGGGDLPEHVYHGLYDAVYNMQWSPNAMKMVFLVGDAPPHTEYQDAFSNINQILRDANDKQIVLHTIRCGDDPDTALAWERIADKGHGSFSTIAQTGGVAVIATPYDDKLAELNNRLNGTAIIGGGEGARHTFEGKMGVEKKEYVATKTAEREGILKELAGVSKQRTDYLMNNKTKGPAGFDDVVDKAIEKEASGYGLKY